LPSKSPKDKTHLYGIVDGEPAAQPPFGERLLRIRELVEKPKPESAPSNLAITGRYVLPSAIFDCLERTKPGAEMKFSLRMRCAFSPGARALGLHLRRRFLRRRR